MTRKFTKFNEEEVCKFTRNQIKELSLRRIYEICSKAVDQQPTNNEELGTASKRYVGKGMLERNIWGIPGCGAGVFFCAWRAVSITVKGQ